MIFSNKRHCPAAAAACLVLAGLLLFGCIAVSCGKPKEIPRIALKEGLVLPAIKALAFNSEGTEIFSLLETGELYRWDLLRGSLLSDSRPDGNAELPPLETVNGGNGTVPPVLSPDGTKKISAAADGSVCLSDAASGKELARYYGFGESEWISIVPEGFYNASSRGSSFLELSAGKRRYSLLQLSGALFRPDLFTAQLAGLNPTGKNPAPPETLESLAGENRAPPLVSLSYGEGELKIKISAGKGGAGLVALYRRSGETEIPAGLFRAETAADKKYTEKGSVCYEMRESLYPGEIGVSAFNSNNTVESERHWLTIPGEVPSSPAAHDSSPLPALRALLVSGDAGTGPGEAGALEESLLQQKEAALYSGVELKTLYGEEFNRSGFTQALRQLCAGAGRNDVMLIYLRGWGRADPSGDLVVSPHKPGITPGNETPEAGISGEYITGESIIEEILKTSANPLLLLDIAGPETELETALLRFRQRLGPKAMLASFPNPETAPGAGGSFVSSVNAALNADLSGNGTITGPGRYIGAVKLLERAGDALKGQGSFTMTVLPLEDFKLADVLINTGELKFQTMTSGMLKIDQVDKKPVSLIFGATMIRTLRPGSYIIDMIYRNGYRETKTVELRKKDSKWVTFNYTPPLLVGDFSAGNLSRQLPSLGINLSELNPANYGKINKEAMEGMGMAPYYVAYLAGEKLYKEGSYDKAIAEYSRSISLKADYTDAYVSRGSARRKKGDLDRAIEDYTRALTLKNGYAEVYNYRGFVYAQKGILDRAIEDYTLAIRYRAGYTDAYFNRAYAYGKQGNWDSCIADYTQVLKLEPSNAVAYNQRGNAWYSKGDKAKAAADFAVAEKLGNRPRS